MDAGLRVVIILAEITPAAILAYSLAGFQGRALDSSGASALVSAPEGEDVVRSSVLADHICFLLASLVALALGRLEDLVNTRGVHRVVVTEAEEKLLQSVPAELWNVITNMSVSGIIDDPQAGHIRLVFEIGLIE
ncbi:hypothetical protein PG985_002760 [Apiospora marii]|uniref:uncharacterized protein n=1 Tax=Apiospora marii TaxID=335849 RepID=UPI00312DCDAF